MKVPGDGVNGIFEAFCGDKGHASAFALQQSIRSHGGTVQKHHSIRETGAAQGLNDLIVSRGIKKYSQMKLRMWREALEKLNRQAGEMRPVAAQPMSTVRVQ